MGQGWRPNQAIGLPLMLALLLSIKKRIKDAISPRELNYWAIFSVYVVIIYVVPLRGSDGCLLNLEGLKKHRGRGGRSGPRVKGEHHECCHFLVPLVPVTSLDIKVAEMLDYLITIKQVHGIVDSHATSNKKGFAFSTCAIDDCLHKVLGDLFNDQTSLFPDHIEGKRN
jgi:hypothetical protein